MIVAPVYSVEDLERERRVAVHRFRHERLEEPLDDYLQHVDHYLAVVEDLLEVTANLTAIEPAALEILGDPDLYEAFRYLAGPPISTDDLKTVAEIDSLRVSRLRADPAAVDRIIEVVRIAMDRRRFPWVSEGRVPSDSERSAAVLASAALIATRRVETGRRMSGKARQEERVAEAFRAAGLHQVPTRSVEMLSDAPRPGEFCRESLLGTRKADFILRLWDRRVLAIECKVSNSATNSVKRLNNDAAAKARAWREDFGKTQVVPAAVLSGVYKVHNLMDAQDRGLTLFWEHDLQALIRWIAATREAP